MALSRFFSSNSSSTIERSAPRSPRNFSSVRGRRPSPSAKFARSVCSSVGRGPLVDLLRLADHPLELGADGVDVDGHAGVLEREQADAQGALDERAPIPRRALPQERGEGRVRQGQAVDDDPVALDTDRRVERDDGGFHVRDGRTHP